MPEYRICQKIVQNEEQDIFGGPKRETAKRKFYEIIPHGGSAVKYKTAQRQEIDQIGHDKRDEYRDLFLNPQYLMQKYRNPKRDRSTCRAHYDEFLNLAPSPFVSQPVQQTRYHLSKPRFSYQRRNPS